MPGEEPQARGSYCLSRINGSCLSKHRMGFRVLLPALLALVVLGIVGNGPTALASGGKPGAGGISPHTFHTPPLSGSCPADVSNPGPTTAATVYYVSATSAVNVRQGPGTGYCVVTSQNSTGDVVAVPGVATVNANGYTWIKVAFYLGACQFCTNYSWSDTGWMATSFLTQATNNWTCELSGGCDEYVGAILERGWPFTGYPPTNPEWSKSTCLANPGSSGNNGCFWYNYNQNRSLSGLQSYMIGADPANPNWFYIYSGAELSPFLAWNYDWWAH